MSGYLRRAGSARLADGGTLVWTVADGSRGRRWRGVVTVDGHITHAVLLEVASDGTVARLELTTPGGLLTLHPGSDGRTLYGNVVTSDAVRHLSFDWGDDRAIAVTGRPIADAITVHRLAGVVGVGEGSDLRMLVIGADLAITETSCRFERVTEDTWRLVGQAGERTLTIDPRGIPFGATGAEWPLELDHDRPDA